MADNKGGYQRPTATSYVSSSWQDHKNRKPPSGEPGTDYGCAYGSSLYAPEDGTISDLKLDNSGAMGRFVAIDLTDGRRTRSLHLSRVLVTRGQKVKRGQLIGYTGASAWGKDWGVGAHVHQTLFPAWSYQWSLTIDFDKQVGPDNDGSPTGGGSGTYNQVTADRQNWLNSRGWKLIVDGIEGPKTKAAYAEYQRQLNQILGTKLAVDGVWGPATQAAHQRFYDSLQKPPAPSQPAGHRATVADLASLPNTRGLQKVAKLYGYTGGFDNQFGGGSQAGFQRFLNQNYGGSLPAWLRAKYGYVGNDIWGPVMAAAASRADTANWAAL
jgi:hypothetical protein